MLLVEGWTTLDLVSSNGSTTTVSGETRLVLVEPRNDLLLVDTDGDLERVL